RIVDVGVPASRLLVVIPHDDMNISPTLVNGQTVTDTSLILGRGPGWYRMIENGDGFGTALLLDSSLADRGWPATRTMFITFLVPQEALRQLRHAVEQAFVVASYFPSQLASRQARLGLQETVLAALDAVFAQAGRDAFMRAVSFQTSMRIVDRLEEVLAGGL